MTYIKEITTDITTYSVCYDHSGAELFTEFTGPVELTETYRRVVGNYNELKSAGDFAGAALMAEDARAVSDRLLGRWGANETWLTSIFTDAEPGW